MLDEGVKRFLCALGAVLAVLFVLTFAVPADAATIYDIEGVFAPALGNEVSASFEGTMTFETDVTDVEVEIQLTNEETFRTVPMEMTLNLPGNAFQPFDIRQYAGVFEEEPVLMFMVDYDMEAGDSFDATILNDGGGWDAWAISFVDYPVGSVSGMSAVAVNEPAALALFALGGVFVFGMLRGTD